MFTLGEIKTAKRLMCVYGDNAKIVPCTQSLILVCDNCKMYDACINYPGRISAWSEDMVNKIIEDIRANGTEEELKVLEKYSLDSLKME